jgi:hypothetical protein
MAKRLPLAVLAVFTAWFILDYLLHGLLLRATYEATADLWRPLHQIDMPLMHLVTLVFAICFVLIYGLLIGRKSLATGLQYGALFGLATGISMGFGSYSFMPIPLSLAVSWFLGTWIEAIAAGAIVGVIVKG